MIICNSCGASEDRAPGWRHGCCCYAARFKFSATDNCPNHMSRYGSKRCSASLFLVTRVELARHESDSELGAGFSRRSPPKHVNWNLIECRRIRKYWKTDLSFPLTRRIFCTGADLGAVAFCTVIKNDIMPSDCPFPPQPPNSGSHSDWLRPRLGWHVS